CLIDVLMEAARRYVADPDATGCLVLEGAHCNDKPAREAACEFYIAAENLIRTYVAMRYPQEADRTTDFMGTLMAGLSAKARAGYSLERLQESVLLAGDVLERLLPD
ncbi:putative transcriptional regulator, partial [Salmonella enterica subsp. enterica serovar Montevideo str. CT_02035327]